MGIRIGNFMISYYGLFIVLGIVFGTLLGYVLSKMFEIDFNDFITLAGCTGIGALVGAKILYILVLISQIDVSQVLTYKYLNGLLRGGFVFYGGVMGGLTGAFFCGKIFNMSIQKYIHIYIPVIPLVHAFGRIGCLMVGCCYGVPYSGAGAVVYNNSPVAPRGIKLFPVQGVEAFLNICLAFFLFQYVKSKKEKSVELYLLIYAIFRYVLEFLRYDRVERGVCGALSVSQWISLFIIIGMTILLYKKKTILKIKKDEKEGN